jgi:cysteinyl-tRNA synthetase
MIKLYNSLTKKKEKFLPIEKNKVKIYSCGPTVYDFVHIGNLRSFVFADILVKTLDYFNYQVNWIQNITDVDDKTIKGAKKKYLDLFKSNNSNEILKKFTGEYFNYYLEDINKLNISKPNIIPKATDSIKEIEFLINKLYERKFAYISKDGIYFDVSKDKKYGKLVNLNFSSMKENKENRVILDEYEKNEAFDFALWKFKKEEDEPSWIIEIDGKKYEGRPGWHIECSAMSFKYFGDFFDIHTGGVDLKFPHHENEIAQSSCALNISLQARYWMHNEHLLVNGKKMSKSLGNFYTLRNIEEKGFIPIALRELFLRTHYRQQLNFTFESLEESQNNIKKIEEFFNWINNLKEIEISKDEEEKINLKFEKEIYNNYLDKFENALKDDLNTPVALSALYEFIRDVYKLKELTEFQILKVKEFLERVNKVLSIIIKKEDDIPKEILKLAKERKKARDEKNFELADKLRNQIKELGYEVKDKKEVKEGFILSKI